MAAKTVLNYLERDSVIHKMTGTTSWRFSCSLPLPA